MTFDQIFLKAKEMLMACDASVIEGHIAFQINITGEGSGAFYVEANNGKLAVEPYEYYDRDVMMTATADDFLKIFNGDLNPVMAYTTGKLKIEGDLGKALELQKLLENRKKEEKKAEKAEKKAAKKASKSAK